MYILAIETTGAFASVALMKDDKIIGHVSGNDRFSHLQNLMPQVETVIKENKLSIGDIDLIAVSNGPGSFTGIRIGVSTARALSQILDIPCVAVPSLDALALRGAEHAKGDILICPMLDARRMEVYTASYMPRECKRIKEVEALVVDEHSFEAELMEQPVFFFGNGAEKCKAVLTHSNAHFVDGIVIQAKSYR